MKKINTRKALNPAYRKHKPLRKDVNQFVEQLKECIDVIKHIDNVNESEEHLKEPIKNFLQKTFYKENLINTKDRIDLAIYLGKNAKSEVGVLIEAKKPSNKAEFLTPDNLNRKALQELLLYYLRERLDNKNNSIKHLVATNGYEWYLFKAEDFYNIFFKNKPLIKEYEAFRDGLKDTTKNELFYNEIAKKYIELAQDQLPFVHLDFNKTNFDTLSDAHLNTLYKIFSDVHLLGHSFGNDSNQLNKVFYNELLHIIGLEEVKDKGKKIIYRKSEKTRDYASLLENTIFTLEDRDYLGNVKGFDADNDKAFNVGLDLCLTWVNRILFLKLLESQLLTYHKGAKEYKFLQSDFINGFDDLNNLFFSALAKKTGERHPRYKDKFQYIPYLNSSLFERNNLETDTFEVSALNDDEMEVLSTTVLKDAKGKRLKGKLNTLDYLFKFLEAYDFTTDGTEGIAEEHENKTLINASVLGLIFEKINGYKEGSFYTPAYITMYMCKETLRRAVVQKFKEQENDQIETFEDLQAYCHRFFKVDDTTRFNKIVNSLRICDPAVGSGHFLVSALNELIAIKNELGFLVDAKGMALGCDIQIENDELYIEDKRTGLLFEYNPNDKESVRIQHTLFHEKQTIIENCLFGVDINPNSVKICRLRLWIELLKNAYYKSPVISSGVEIKELQTLPNIDINIKCGNSLISRFNLDDDLKDAFKGKEVKYNFKQYKAAVEEYKNTNSKEKKREVLQIINEVKNNFKSTLDNKFTNNFIKIQEEFISENERINNLKQFEEKITKAEKDRLAKLKLKLENAFLEKEEIVNNAIYHNAFEWRFEFPEVLNDEGKYLGFDTVIGNPPYVQMQSMKEMSKIYKTFNYTTFQSTGDLYALFYEKGEQILSDNGYLGFITGSAWLRSNYGKALRKFFIDKTSIIELIDFSDCEIFDSATVLTNIMLFKKAEQNFPAKAIRFTKKDQNRLDELKNVFDKESIFLENLTENSWVISDKTTFKIKNKVEEQGVKLIDWNIEIYRGILTGFNEAFIINKEKRDELIAKDEKSKEIIKPILRGRDIQKYYKKFNDLYIINTHNGLRREGIQPIDVNNYSAIKSHLDKFSNRLIKRSDKGVTPYNLRNCAYLEAFDKPKIIFPNMTKFLPFLYDNKGFYTNQKCYIITGVSLEYLVSFFNSNLFKFCFEDNFPELQGNTRELNKVIFEQIPVKKITKEQEKYFIENVDKITILKNENPKADTTVLEQEIDQLVYKLYGLTEEEIAIVENS